jgi:hypothetical protein
MPFNLPQTNSLRYKTKTPGPMVTMKRCPKCTSSRIRRGYAHDPLLIRMLGFRELLCDSCNLRFRGFVIPGTLPRTGRHKKKPDNQKAAVPRGDNGRQMRNSTHSERRPCPKCSGQSTHRSHRRGLVENLASVANYYPYRCDDCNNRFLGKRKRSAIEPV